MLLEGLVDDDDSRPTDHYYYCYFEILRIGEVVSQYETGHPFYCLFDRGAMFEDSGQRPPIAAKTEAGGRTLR